MALPFRRLVLIAALVIALVGAAAVVSADPSERTAGDGAVDRLADHVRDGPGEWMVDRDHEPGAHHADHAGDHATHHADHAGEHAEHHADHAEHRGPGDNR